MTEHSHLFNKLRKAVIVARLWTGQEETESKVIAVTTFDLDDMKIYAQVKNDYELVQTVIKEGFDKLTGRMGIYIQPRTKGSKNSTSRAFYARVPFLKEAIFPHIGEL